MRMYIGPKFPVDTSEWHKWFAWHPVIVGNTLVWLETVDRKLEYSTYDVWPDYRLRETYYC